MATLNDVAKVANVSVSTVSRVISGSSLISRETADKVRLAMDEVNYHPNAVAKSLAKNMRTRIIGLVLPRDTYSVFHNQFFMDALSGIALCAQKNDYYIMNAYQEEDNSHSTIKKMTKCRWIEGAILTTAKYDDPNIKYLEKEKIPYAVIGTPIEGEHALCVDNNNEKAMEDICIMLIDKGIKRLALICGDTKYVYNKNRYDGYIKALTKNNLPVDDDIITFCKAEVKCGYEAMEALLKKDVEAVVTTDDILAFGAVHCMNDNDKIIPVTGFNNTMMTEIMHPYITSVDIRAEKLGYEACNMLISRLEDSKIKTLRLHQVETKIVHRESTDMTQT